MQIRVRGEKNCGWRFYGEHHNIQTAQFDTVFCVCPKQIECQVSKCTVFFTRFYKTLPLGSYTQQWGSLIFVKSHSPTKEITIHKLTEEIQCLLNELKISKNKFAALSI